MNNEEDKELHEHCEHEHEHHGEHELHHDGHDECGCEHEHGHHHDEHDECGCGHEHHHDEHDECGCEHEHGHHHHHHCACCSDGDDDCDDEEDEKGELIKIIVSAVLFAGAIVLEKIFAPGIENYKTLVRAVYLALYAAAYILTGLNVLREAAENLFHGKFFGEEFLMSVATIGAVVMGEYSEAVAVMLLFCAGEFLEGKAVGSSRRSIRALVNIRPDKANVLREGNVTEVLAEEVSVGETIVVKPGERIPLDGVITKGESTLDTSALTGESMPRTCTEGDEVLSGSVNVSGVLEIKVSKKFSESTASRILELVENSQSKKAVSEKFITRFAHVYTPIVCIAAVALAVIPSVVLGGGSEVWRTWVYRALELLVVSCPCALVISVPLSFFAGLGLASKNGILIKGSNYIEMLSQTKTAVFDKTGTLTKGVFEVTGVHLASDKITEEELVALATHAEFYSTHPISRSLKNVHHCEECEKLVAEHAAEVGGHGVRAVLNGKNVLVGNLKLMESEGIQGVVQCEKNDDGTVVHVAEDGVYLGHIIISDVAKDGSKDALKLLKKLGVERNVMLTGDSAVAANIVASSLGVDEVHSDLLPQDKVHIVEKLIHGYEKTSKRVAFVGDGINDAPVLTRSDVGIAMGALGSDSAIEAADVVIMDDRIEKVPLAVRLSKKTMLNVRENVIGALGVKTLIMVLCALGITNMWVAVFGDVGVCMLAVLNSMRLLWGAKNKKM